MLSPKELEALQEKARSYHAGEGPDPSAPYAIQDLWATAFALLVIAVTLICGLGILYALVRFIKWAWMN